LLLLAFLPCLDPDIIFFSNDGPLGAVHAAAVAQPSAFKGLWQDLNSVGINGGAIFLAPTGVALWLLGPLGFAKFYAGLSLAILGLCAWTWFRLLKLSPVACVGSALAVVFNSTYFSISCRGGRQQCATAG